MHQVDVGFFVGDEWRVRPNLTLNLGLRYETQTNIHDWRDFAPRLAFAWAPGGAGQKRAKTVLRAGFGIFYDRFGLGNTLTAQRFNGLVQQQYVVPNPDFFPTVPPSAALPGLPIHAGDRRRSARRMRAPYILQSALTIERQLPANTTVGGDLYELARAAPLPLGRHQRAAAGHVQSGRAEQRSVSAGASRAVELMESSGIYNQNQVIANVNAKAERRALAIRLLRVQPRAGAIRMASVPSRRIPTTSPASTDRPPPTCTIASPSAARSI